MGLLSKTSITFFCTFLCRHCTTAAWKCLISRFMKDVNKRRRIFLSLSKLDCSPWKKSTPGKFTYFCHFKRIGMNASKFERNVNSFEKGRFRCRRRCRCWSSLLTKWTSQQWHSPLKTKVRPILIERSRRRTIDTTSFPTWPRIERDWERVEKGLGTRRLSILIE